MPFSQLEVRSKMDAETGMSLGTLTGHGAPNVHSYSVGQSKVYGQFDSERE